MKHPHHLLIRLALLGAGLTVALALLGWLGLLHHPEPAHLALLAWGGLASGLLLLVVVGALAREAWTPGLIAALGGIGLAAWALDDQSWGLLLTGLASALLILAWRGRRAWQRNAVAWKELRARMRGARAFAILGLFLGLLSVFTLVFYVNGLAQFNSGQVAETGQLGRSLFASVVVAQLALVLLIVPSFTAGAITSERERQTYDLLQTTLLSPQALLMGKMQAALGFTNLLILSAIPIQSVALLFGGISQLEVGLAALGLLATALLLGAAGLLSSALTERTLIASARVYGAALTLLIVGAVASAWLAQGAYGNAIQGVATVSDDAARERLLVYSDMLLSGLHPFLTALNTQRALTTYGPALAFNATAASGGGALPLLASWVLLLLSYLWMAAALLLLAMAWLERQQRAESG
ncbi:MAG: hypothetical protein RML73_01125 [Anaerolineae bacterium]|nr:hypothetical protein [Anaerolineae bacterium]